MSAINIIRYRDAVHLCVDGLKSSDGGSAQLVEKTYVAAHLPLVVACRGALGTAQCIGSSLSYAFPSFDDLVDSAEQAIAVVHEAFRVSSPDLPVFRNTEIFLVGWSARRACAEAYQIRVGDEEFAPYPPLTLRPIEDICFAPWPPQFRDADGSDVYATMLGVMEQQRADFPGEIGGFCKLVTVSENVILSRILRRWSEDAHRRH